MKDIEIKNLIQKETRRQQDGLEMIPSENHTSSDVLEAQGSRLTDKYSEGYPGMRYYGGCEFVDQVENLARDRAKKLFAATLWFASQPGNIFCTCCSRRHGYGHVFIFWRSHDTWFEGELLWHLLQLCPIYD